MLAAVLPILITFSVNLGAASHSSTPPPPRQCDSQGFYGIGQPYPETGTTKDYGGGAVIVSIDRVVATRVVGYLSTLKDGSVYFYRASNIILSDRESRALRSFLARSALPAPTTALVDTALKAGKFPAYIHVRRVPAALAAAHLHLKPC